MGEWRHLDGVAEPAGEIGFEAFLVGVAEEFGFADFDHDAAFVLRVEDAGFVDEVAERGFPFRRAVGVVVHLELLAWSVLSWG